MFRVIDGVGGWLFRVGVYNCRRGRGVVALQRPRHTPCLPGVCGHVDAPCYEGSCQLALTYSQLSKDAPNASCNPPPSKPKLHPAPHLPRAWPPGCPYCRWWLLAGGRAAVRLRAARRPAPAPAGCAAAAAPSPVAGQGGGARKRCIMTVLQPVSSGRHRQQGGLQARSGAPRQRGAHQHVVMQAPRVTPPPKAGSPCRPSPLPHTNPWHPSFQSSHLLQLQQLLSTWLQLQPSFHKACALIMLPQLHSRFGAPAWAWVQAMQRCMGSSTQPRGGRTAHAANGCSGTAALRTAHIHAPLDQWIAYNCRVTHNEAHNHPSHARLACLHLKNLPFLPPPNSSHI